MQIVRDYYIIQHAIIAQLNAHGIIFRMERVLVGFVGEAGAGKGAASEPLINLGFESFSLSDSIRKVASTVGKTHEREILHDLGNVLRATFGGDVLARGAKRWVEMNNITRGIIDSIRNPDEVEFLKKELGVFIIGITMSPEKKFELMRGRNRDGDPKTWEEYQRLMDIEKGIGEEETGQQIHRCLEIADVIIPNEGTKEELHQKVQEALILKGFIS